MLCYCHRCQPRFRKREKFRPQLLRLRRYSTHLARVSPATALGRDAAGTPSSRRAPALSLHRFLRSSNAKGETFFFYGFRISEFFIWAYLGLALSRRRGAAR